MLKDDRVRLQHMLDAAQKVVTYSQAETRQSLEADEKLQLALTRLIEIIGEAASRVSPEIHQTYPQIPWQPIRGMRNRLIHAYFAVDLDILWETVQQSIPQLIPVIHAILEETDEP